MNQKNNVQDQERRFLPEPVIITVEKRGDKEVRLVSGYAAVFNQLSRNLGWFREKIEPGAFDNVLENDVVALFNHEPNLILARTISKTLKLSVDERGLKYEFEAPNTTAGNDLVVSLERGDIQHSSFSFSIEKEKWEEDEEAGEIRTVLEVKRLYDVSPVVFPAYTQTDVAMAKRSFDEWKTARDEDQEKDLPFDDLDILEQENELRKLML
jgi:HK97 family phage prohead protease